MNKVHIFLTAAVMVAALGCGGRGGGGQTESDAGDVGTPPGVMFVTDENGLVWRVPPTLEYDSLRPGQKRSLL